MVLDAHSALNIALFPPLFFFAGLYYTDVISTLQVLLSYKLYLEGRPAPQSALHKFNVVFVGVLALSFRQTNIFWVAVFPAGLALVDVLKGDLRRTTDAKEGDAASIFRDSWSEGLVFDCAVADAGPRGKQMTVKLLSSH